MGMLFEQARLLVNGQIVGTPEDVIEAYKFLNDNFYADLLDEKQRAILDAYIEAGIIDTKPFPIGSWT